MTPRTNATAIRDDKMVFEIHYSKSLVLIFQTCSQEGATQLRLYAATDSTSSTKPLLTRHWWR